MPMKPSDPTIASSKNEAPKLSGRGRPELGGSSIHYVGAKDPRVPVPIVLLILVALAGAAIAVLRHFGT